MSQENDVPPKFVPFFTGKKYGVYWYLGQRWFGESNQIGKPGPRGLTLITDENRVTGYMPVGNWQ